MPQGKVRWRRSEAVRLFQAAEKAGVCVRLEVKLDGTLVAVPIQAPEAQDNGRGAALCASTKPLKKQGASVALAAGKGRPFDDCGFSNRTINALVACGIDAPEKLEAMDRLRIRVLPGIGEVTMQEIVAYLDRRLSVPASGEAASTPAAAPLG